jgi:hypothetical protein
VQKEKCRANIFWNAEDFLLSCWGALSTWKKSLNKVSWIVTRNTLLLDMSRFPFPMRSLDFLFVLILPGTLCPWGSTQPLTEMSTRNLPGGKGQPARKADNLTAICETIVLKIWEPRHLIVLWASTDGYRDSFTFIFNSEVYTDVKLFEIKMRNLLES